MSFKPLDHLPEIGEHILVYQMSKEGERIGEPRPATIAHVKTVSKINPELYLNEKECREPYIDEVIRGFVYDDEMGGADMCIMRFNGKAYGSPYVYNKLIDVELKP